MGLFRGAVPAPTELQGQLAWAFGCLAQFLQTGWRQQTFDQRLRIQLQPCGLFTWFVKTID